MIDHETTTFDREEPVVKNPTEARQGSNRAPVHYVLLGGLSLAGLAFLLMFFVH